MRNIRKIRKSGTFIASLFFLVLICTLSVTTASAYGAALKVDIIKYEPNPAEIGQYVSIWVKIENIGYSRADDVSLEVIPSYPFSLDSSDNAVKHIGILSTDNAALYEYRLYVDENAKPGTGSIKIRYQADESIAWSEEEFDLRVGSDTIDSKGTIQLVQIRTEPEVLKPGDIGTVTLTLKNSSSHYSFSIDGKEYDTNAKVRSADLSSANDITVTSDPHLDTGILGPNDAINLTYNIQVADSAKGGTYHLQFSVTGSSHAYSNNWDIPVKVDSAGIKVIPTKPLRLINGEATLEFDVVNTHPNTLCSVSISPQADGVEFSPMEYFIGSMDNDELFTVEFDARAVSINSSTPKDITLIARYRNGFNQHESSTDDLNLEIVSDESKGGIGMAGFGLLFAIFAISGVVMYRRMKNNH
jgi:hypothetical protein